MSEDKGSSSPQSSGDATEKTTRDATGAEGGDVVPLRPPKPCPNCGKPSTRKAYPFCSSRCADVDLNRWLSGQYVVPGRPLEDGDEDEA